MTIRRWIVVTVVCLVGAAAPAFAQGPGVQVGVSGTPSQFYMGGQYEMPSGIDRLWFRPNVEIGIGHDETLTGINFEFAYRKPLSQTDWRLYVGGGPALDLTRLHDGPTSASGGLNLLLGVSHEGGLFTEFKVGLFGGPDIRFGVGYTF
jgi:hypothetical protein